LVEFRKKSDKRNIYVKNFETSQDRGDRIQQEAATIFVDKQDYDQNDQNKKQSFR
jgi:hypothetical protein